MSGAVASPVAGPLPAFVERLLDETPQVRDRVRQEALTARFLAPALPALEALFLQLRAEADPGLRAARPAVGGKAYPLSQCLAITQAVQARLDTLDPATLSGPAAEGWAALDAFLDAGGLVRRAWGDLRGQYFQNALVVGALYVDVSNDTVVIEKPPVEILPFAEAGFRPVADFVHFARIAGRYWRRRILPNHLIPDLAPYLPLIEITPEGRISLGTFNRYMLGLTLAEGFAPSGRALAGATLPPTAFAGMSVALRGAPVAADAESGRAAALACCRAYRARGLADCPDAYRRAVAAGREVNLRLARLVALPQGAS